MILYGRFLQRKGIMMCRVERSGSDKCFKATASEPLNPFPKRREKWDILQNLKEVLKQINQ